MKILIRRHRGYEVLRNTDTDALRLYPDPAAKDLVHAIAGEYGLQDDQVFVGVGSDDVLAMSFLTFFNSKNQFCS